MASDIGDAAFGTDADQAVAYLSQALGAPTEDSGWQQTGYDPRSQDDQCRAPELRYVTWSNLTVVIGTYDPVSGVVSERRTMTTYYYGTYEPVVSDPLGLTTDRGLKLGDDVARVRELYPGASVDVSNFDESAFFFAPGQVSGYVAVDGRVSRVDAGTDMCPV